MRKEDISQESWLCFFLERQVGCCLLHIDGSDIIRAPRGVWIAMVICQAPGSNQLIGHGESGSGGRGGVRFYNRGA